MINIKKKSGVKGFFVELWSGNDFKAYVGGENCRLENTNYLIVLLEEQDHETKRALKLYQSQV